MIDMGDFAGGMLKYLRAHPIPALTIGGGFAKLCKLAQGHLDLHSGRSQVDFDWLAEIAAEIGADGDVAARLCDAGSAGAALAIAPGSVDTLERGISPYEKIKPRAASLVEQD